MSASMSSRSSSRVLLPMFWIGCEQVVDEPGGDASEHRLPFLLLDVFLQVGEPRRPWC